MEPQKYKYTAQARRGSIDYSYRPLIEIEVGGEKKSRIFKALVDSGTDVTIMDSAIAELLGIDSKNRTSAQISGVGEAKDGFVAPVSLRVEKFPDRVYNFEVIFAENLSNNFEIILGQQDFFRNFDVMFKKSEDSFYITPVT
jgi:Aspartyl protease